jgi:hypothetical protein
MSHNKLGVQKAPLLWNTSVSFRDWECPAINGTIIIGLREKQA